MPRVYTVEFENQTWAAADTDIDLLELDPAAEKPIALKALVIKTTSELQEAQEEWCRLRVIVGHTTSGSTPDVSPTPRPLSPNDAAAGFTAECLNATIASAGTAINLLSDAFQVRNGYELWLPPEDWIWTSGANLLVVRGMNTVADDVNLNLTAWVVEVP